MDERTSPSKRARLLPCLLPLDTLQQNIDENLLVLEAVETPFKQLSLQENTEEECFPWKEYRMHGQPQSLQAFLDLFLLENGEYDKHRAIWIPESDSFVCIKQETRVPERVPEAYRERVFEVELLSNERSSGRLSFFSATVEQAMLCLEFLFGLHDSHFEELGLSYHVPGEDARERPICPLTNRCLEKLSLQNEKRKNMFYHMAFTPEQSRVLATSGTIIGLFNCSFPDEGVAFVDAARQHSSLAKLSLYVRLPFDDRNFVWSLDHLILEYLKLSQMTLNDESCRAVAATEINYLDLECCEFEDEEAVQVLVDNIRAGRGPTGLCLNGEPFKSSEKLGDFMNALRGNTYLKRLDLVCLEVRDGSFQALVAALPENIGVTHLGLAYCTVDDRCWDKLMSAIAEHPSLRTLSFLSIRDDNKSWLLRRHDPIHALAGMLAENEQVEEIEVDGPWDRDVWNAVVVPRLEINSYRKRFLPIQKIQNRETRAAVMARALAHLKKKTSLRLMLMSQNEDILSCYLSEALTRNDAASFI
jgi:hypothetical protein